MTKTEFMHLSIDKLLLDLENPRLGSLANQSDALAAIILLSQKHFRNLANSIKTYGLDPGDSLYVIEDEESDDYIVVEGNRRLSALMVLSNAAVLESTSLSAAEKKNLGSLATGFKRSLVEPIRCTLFNERSEANEWIYRRHTGQAEGEGRIDWGPLEVQRFNGDRTVLDVMEFMHRNGGYSSEDWDAVHDALAKNSSILSRILESKACREFLGLSTRKVGKGTIPEYSAPTEFIVQALGVLFDDIRKGKVNTRTLNKAVEIETYLAKLRDALNPADYKDAKPKPFRDVQSADKKQPLQSNETATNSSQGDKQSATASEAQARPRKTTRARSVRVNLAPKLHEFKQPETTKGQALVREASNLNADEYPLASAFLLRAFLEHTIDAYMTANNIPRWEAGKELNLQQRGERVMRHIIDNGLADHSGLRGVKATLTGGGDPASIQSLNDYHHAAYRLPTADTIRTAWDSSIPLFIAVYGKA